MWMRTGTRCAERTQVKIAFTEAGLDGPGRALATSIPRAISLPPSCSRHLPSRRNLGGRYYSVHAMVYMSVISIFEWGHRHGCRSEAPDDPRRGLQDRERVARRSEYRHDPTFDQHRAREAAQNLQRSAFRPDLARHGADVARPGGDEADSGGDRLAALGVGAAGRVRPAEIDPRVSHRDGGHQPGRDAARPNDLPRGGG